MLVEGIGAVREQPEDGDQEQDRARDVQNAALAYTFPNTLGWLTNIPSHFFSALPFIITLIVLIASSLSKKKKSGEPQAIGRNYYREDR